MVRICGFLLGDTRLPDLLPLQLKLLSLQNDRDDYPEKCPAGEKGVNRPEHVPECGPGGGLWIVSAQNNRGACPEQENYD